MPSSHSPEHIKAVEKQLDKAIEPAPPSLAISVRVFITGATAVSPSVAPISSRYLVSGGFGWQFDDYENDQ